MRASKWYGALNSLTYPAMHATGIKSARKDLAAAGRASPIGAAQPEERADARLTLAELREAGTERGWGNRKIGRDARQLYTAPAGPPEGKHEQGSGRLC